MFAGTDAPCVNHVAYEDAAVAYLACMCCFDDHLHGGLDKLVATNDGQCHTFYDVGRVLNATIDTLLSALTNAMHVVILKPVDVRRKQRFLDILKLRLPDDSFNSFHTLIIVTNERPILTHCNVFDAKV